ncbi:DNA alkylation repair protein [Bacillus manliponensis]|uniref:DNA alkylation repair protein n=1 Tax=Bacillus manliponensis TaxID=574376 RepID=UPI00351814A5
MTNERLQQVMKQLEEYGTEQNRKVYKRHGAKEPLFGVSFSNLNTMKKEIKKDHELAVALWNTGNMDAQTLATMIVDSKQFTSEQLDEWIKDSDYYGLIDVLMSPVSKSSLAMEKMKDWTKSEDEWIGRAGWTILSHIAMKDKKLEDSFFLSYLETIENTIHGEKNRKKQAMHSALMAIGLRNDELEKQAICVAQKIGKVHIDHGDTSCKTPDAEAYIKKGRDRERNKKAKVK